MSTPQIDLLVYCDHCDTVLGRWADDPGHDHNGDALCDDCYYAVAPTQEGAPPRMLDGHPAQLANQAAAQ